uniref:Uncharacterized protein n=1 Tax=Ascaris lumbricoides TaxID=6252 RepID=A0A0M3HJ41_ASCLU
LLLLNATIIIVISISTDYWIKISYLVDRVPKGCRLTNYVEYSTIECANERRILTDQHSNLFRQCNDLTEGIRGNVSRWGLLYADSCTSFLWDRRWRLSSCTPLNDILALLFGLLGLFVLPLGLYSSQNREHSTRTSLLLGTSTISFSCPIFLSLINIHHIHSQQTKSRIDAIVRRFFFY